MIVWMFPGQGSQKPGMDRKLQATKELLAKADSVLGTDVEKLYRKPLAEWPAAFIQPAIFIISVAAGRASLAIEMRPEAVVGHSLGEYAALVMAGGLDFDDALRLVVARGRAMAKAGRINSGGMAAVIGLDAYKVEEACGASKDVWVANYNTPSQTVISGKDEGLAEAAERCLSLGAERVIRLRVPVAAHTPLMASAEAELRSAFEDVSLKEPSYAFYSVVDGKLHSDPNEIRELLIAGVTSPVRFADTINVLRSDNAQLFVEIGPGRILQGLVSDLVPEAEVAGISSDEDAAQISQRLQTPIGTST